MQKDYQNTVHNMDTSYDSIIWPDNMAQCGFEDTSKSPILDSALHSINERHIITSE